MRTDKELGALRVMEALSAVDAELLARSEKTTVKSKHKMTVRRFVQRYGVACAACLCLLVLGAAYFGMSRMRMGAVGGGKGTDGNCGGADNGFAPMTAGELNDAPEEVPEYAEQEAAEDYASDGGMSVRPEPEWLDVEQLAVQSDTARNQELTEETLKTEAAKQDELAATTPVDSDGSETQRKPVAEGVGAEAAVPESYSRAETENGNQGSLLYEWSDGEHSLWLRITQTELTADMRFDVEPPVYTVQEGWRELLPDAGVDGYVQFALLYENGVLAEYCGALEREEVVRLLESLIE